MEGSEAAGAAGPAPGPGWRPRIPLEKHRISCSLSVRVCCWDNAVVESFLPTLWPRASGKQSLEFEDNRSELISSQPLQRDLAFWIESCYSRERHHATSGQLSPILDE